MASPLYTHSSIMPASFTLSEFSEFVAAALDGCDDLSLQAPASGGRDQYSSRVGRSFHLDCLNTPVPRHRNGAKLNGFTTAFHSAADSLFTLNSNTTSYRITSSNEYISKMLIISPPGPGPIPSPITPIIEAASMSTIDISTNCLSLGIGQNGCGGTISKSALEITVPSHSFSPSNTSPSTPNGQRHRPLALLAKIKRQLSKSNVGSSNMNTSNFNDPANTDLHFTPSSHLPRQSGKSRGRALSLSSGAAHPTLTVSNAHIPFHSTSFTSNFNTSTSGKANNDVSAPTHRPRRRSSSSDSVISLSASMSRRSYSYSHADSVVSALSGYSGDSAFIGGSVTSYIDVGEPSIIGSSASFFAAINRGRDGRTGRRGSGTEEDADSEIFQQGGLEGEFGFSDPDAAAAYWNSRRSRGTHMLSEFDGGSHLESSLQTSGEDDVDMDADVDGRSMQSYAPYLPLAMQLERQQQGLKMRVSLEDVTSLVHAHPSIISRPSFVASSMPSNGRGRGWRSEYPVQDVEDGYLVSKFDSDSNSPLLPNAILRKHVPPPLQPTPLPPRSSIGVHPYAAALKLQYSPASTASSRSPITPSTPFFTASEASLEGDSDEGDGESRISAEPASLEKPVRFGKATSLSSNTNTPAAGIRVHVLPPTPKISDLAPKCGNAIIGEMASLSPRATNNAYNEASNHSVSKSRASRHKQNRTSKSPPMLPPPSGPLPIPPPPKKSKATTAAHHRSLSPERSVEWVFQRHSLPLTRKPSREIEFWDDDEDEDVLNMPDDSGIAFGPTNPSILITPNAPAEGNFLSTLHPRSSMDTSAGESTGESEYASFASESEETSPSMDIVHTEVQTIGAGRQTMQVEEAKGDWTLGLGMEDSKSMKRTPELASVATPVVPTVVVSPDLDRLNLRERTKSESALGMGKAKRMSEMVNDDWTLSLPLPAPAGKPTSKSTTGAAESDSASSLFAQKEKKRRSAPVQMPIAYPYTNTDDTAPADDGNMDTTSIYTDEVEPSLDYYPSEAIPPMEVKQVVLCVPRVVTRGSGIESGTRSRSSSTCRRRGQPTVFEASEEDQDDESELDATPAAVNENLAQLDALSADLARFNEMLRVGESQLRKRTSSGRLMVPTSQLGLKRARSCGVLEVDEPPPKHAILREACVGDLLGGENTLRLSAKTRVINEAWPLPIFSIDAPMDDDSPTLPQTAFAEPYHPIVDLSAEHSLRRSSSTYSQSAILTTSLSRACTRNSGTSFSSSRNSICDSVLTVTPVMSNTKPRTTLPFASSPSFAYYQAAKPSSSNVLIPKVDAVRPGLASGSALDRKPPANTATLKSVSRSTANSESTPIKGDNLPPIRHFDDNTLTPHYNEVIPNSEADFELNDVSVLPSSIISSTTTPTKANLPALTISTTPSTPPARSPTSRRMSISSLSSTSSTSSSASLTPTLSPNYDSSTLPTPLASSFPTPPFHSAGSLFDAALRAQTIVERTQAPQTGTRTQKIPSNAITSSPKRTFPTLEERIRQLRQLGMDAVAIRKIGAGVNSSPSTSRTENSSSKTEIRHADEEVDKESICSDVYHSARSSFSLAR